MTNKVLPEKKVTEVERIFEHLKAIQYFLKHKNVYDFVTFRPGKITFFRNDIYKQKKSVWLAVKIVKDVTLEIPTK